MKRQFLTPNGSRKRMVRKVIKFFNKCSIEIFLNTVLYPALVSNNIVEHLRKAWSQWQITKYLIEVAGIEIRMREDFQKDIKILCTSDTFLPIVELVSLP